MGLPRLSPMGRWGRPGYPHHLAGLTLGSGAGLCPVRLRSAPQPMAIIIGMHICVHAGMGGAGATRATNLLFAGRMLHLEPLGGGLHFFVVVVVLLLLLLLLVGSLQNLSTI